MNNNKIIQWILRIAVAGEFFGHGIFALQGKEQWIKWVSQLTSVDLVTAAKMMFIVGIMDLLVAVIVLFRPIKPVLLWAAFWGFGRRLCVRLWENQFGILLNDLQTGALR